MNKKNLLILLAFSILINYLSAKDIAIYKITKTVKNVQALEKVWFMKRAKLSYTNLREGDFVIKVDDKNGGDLYYDLLRSLIIFYPFTNWWECSYYKNSDDMLFEWNNNDVQFVRNITGPDDIDPYVDSFDKILTMTNTKIINENNETKIIAVSANDETLDIKDISQQ